MQSKKYQFIKMRVLVGVLLITVAVVYLATVFAKECTIDNGNSFFGSDIVQTCNCVGYETFGHWEAGADSKCIGFVSYIN
jgi:hypothetical protein